MKRKTAKYFDGIAILTKEKVETVVLEQMRQWLSERNVDVIQIKRSKIPYKKYVSIEEKRRQNLIAVKKYKKKLAYENRKYIGRIPSPVRKFILTIQSKDFIVKYNLENVQYEFNRPADGFGKTKRIYFQPSLFEYLVDRGLVTLKTPGVLHEVWNISPELLKLENIKKYFNWQWREGSKTTEWMLEIWNSVEHK